MVTAPSQDCGAHLGGRGGRQTQRCPLVDLPSPGVGGGLGPAAGGCAYGRGKEVAERTVVRVSAAAPRCSSCNVPVTTRLDSLIKMVKFFSWLCSVLWAEEKGFCMLGVPEASVQRALAVSEGTRGFPWDQLDLPVQKPGGSPHVPRLRITRDDRLLLGFSDRTQAVLLSLVLLCYIFGSGPAWWERLCRGRWESRNPSSFPGCVRNSAFGCGP